MKKLFFILALFSGQSLAEDGFVSIGNDNYFDVGAEWDLYSISIKHSDDYILTGFSRKFGTIISVGAGLGQFYKWYGSIPPRPNETEGYDREEAAEMALALFGQLEYKFIFASLVIAQPEFEITRVRIKNTEPISGSPIERNILERRTDSDDDIEYFFNIGFRVRF